MRSTLTRLPALNLPPPEYIRNVIRDYIIGRFAEELGDGTGDEANDGFDASVSPRDDHYSVYVFVPDAGLVPRANELAEQVRNELRAEGLRTILYIHVWDGSWPGGNGQG